MDEKTFVVVQYLRLGLCINLDDGIGGPKIEARGSHSGSTHMLLVGVPAWLKVNPGTLIVTIRPV